MQFFRLSKSWFRLAASAVLCATLLVSSHPALAIFVQQGLKLVGTDAVGNASQGSSAALSADGNTAIFGGPDDSGGVGAAWVWTRSGGAWAEQSKLIGTGAVGSSHQGFSVALSADGNTAIVGGADDSGFVGAAWVFTRTGGVWTPQGQKLVGLGAIGAANQGSSVALSADGNTAIVGGPYDNHTTGAAWVFTRDNGVWTPQQKLVGTGAIGAAEQGSSVALSADGSAAIVGGPGDNNFFGAAWVFTRDSNGVWTQPRPKLLGPATAGNPQEGYSVALAGDSNTAILGGPNDNSNAGAVWVFISSGGGGGAWSWHQRLVGTGAGGPAEQGSSVALSADGNTFVLGGPSDVNSAGSGAAWVFTRSGIAFSQQGSKLVGTGAVGQAAQGNSVALSADSNTAIVGGYGDTSFAGATWVFFQNSAATHDFNDDGKSDIMWRDTAGNVALWLMNGGQVLSSTVVSNVPTSWSIVGQRDFNGDGKADLLWHDTSGNVAIWLMNGATVTSSTFIANVPTTWSIVGTRDYNGDGKADILWHDTSGNVAVWLMNGGTVTSSTLVANVPTTWSIVGTGDFNGDGKADILWRDNTGNVAIWLMNGATVSSSTFVANVPTTWSIVGTGDFNGDGKADMLWHDNTGNVAIWLMNGATVSSSVFVTNVPTTWSITETGDFNADGKSDILWHDTSGNVAIWTMNGGTVSSNLFVSNVPTTWSIQGAGAD